MLTKVKKDLTNAPLVCTRVNDELMEIFPDNLICQCMVCGHDIMYRPYNKGVKLKVCTECILDQVSKAEET